MFVCFQCIKLVSPWTTALHLEQGSSKGPEMLFLCSEIFIGSRSTWVKWLLFHINQQILSGLIWCIRQTLSLFDLSAEGMWWISCKTTKNSSVAFLNSSQLCRLSSLNHPLSKFHNPPLFRYSTFISTQQSTHPEMYRCHYAPPFNTAYPLYTHCQNVYPILSREPPTQPNRNISNLHPFLLLLLSP